MQLIKDASTGQVRTGKIDFVPTYVSQQKGFRILPVHEAIAADAKGIQPSFSCTSDDISRMKAIWPEATKHLTNAAIGMQPVTISNDGY